MVKFMKHIIYEKFIFYFNIFFVFNRCSLNIIYYVQGLGDHNFCRNPDDDVKPWCWVDIEKGRFGYCAVSQCGVSSSVSPLTTPQSQSNISMPLSTVYNVTPLAGSAIQTTSSALPDENILSTEYGNEHI